MRRPEVIGPRLGLQLWLQSRQRLLFPIPGGSARQVAPFTLIIPSRTVADCPVEPGSL
jgi:hypothetical protein